MGSTDTGSGAFTLKEEPLENLRPLKVRVIGAGYSGIYAAIRYVAPAWDGDEDWGPAFKALTLGLEFQRD